ncbi:hypothetical protein B0T25DRAFT_169480 [Lasiosphaeria hispida]|uniref:Riboflavin kinase n=1 Tax=Lasiosphaeria hispida TaxID=260671 RepID=A0AAJ0HMT4_9PEZI|nr:hypothetical protein B0T25DRAFT_169480 [Lasiosphaeria hispida]
MKTAQTFNKGSFRTDENLSPASRNGDTSWLRPQGRLRVQTSMPNLSAGHFTASPGSIMNSAASRTTSFGPETPLTPASSTFSIPRDVNPATDNPDKPFWQAALSETRHFAGGLMPHPTESTKHFTILRHSPALVFYRGPTTSVEITIFSASKYPLPPDRTIWLQQRGFSGDSGMKLKTLVGATSDWVDVTPSAHARVEEVAPNTERAWQRDIAKAAKRSVKDKGHAKAHIPRETHVVRIPAMSADGYFRLALCSGGTGGDASDFAPDGNNSSSSSRRKVLCNSPIFRVASTSSDSSVFRGASISTMPLEVGVKVASVMAKATVTKYTGPVAGLVQGRIDKLKPGISALGISSTRDAPSAQYFPSAPQHHTTLDDDFLRPIGPDSGPEDPFPLKFSGRVTPGTGRSQAELGTPTANLTSLAPDDISHRLRGVYFGWACFVPPDNNTAPRWHEAVISAGPAPYPAAGRPLVAAETSVTVHLFHEFGTSFFGAKIRVIVMGFLRPVLRHDAPLQQRLDIMSRDVLLTVASLGGRKRWAPDVAVDRLRAVKSARGLSDRVADARERVQRRVEDAVPVHRLGFRTAGAEDRDGGYGRGGYWVSR